MDQHLQQRAFLHGGRRHGPADRRADESRAEISDEVHSPRFDLADVVLLSQCLDLLDGHRIFEAPSWGSIPLLSPYLQRTRFGHIDSRHSLHSLRANPTAVFMGGILEGCAGFSAGRFLVPAPGRGETL